MIWIRRLEPSGLVHDVSTLEGPGTDSRPKTRPRYHTIVAIVEDKPGVLMRIASLFARRGYNIESLTVGETESPKFSRMTITLRAEEKVIEALKQGLRKFVNVAKVLDFTGIDHVERDLALIKLNTPGGARQEILELVQVFEGKIVDIGLKDIMIELVGPESKIEAFLNVVRPYGIKEMVRTGRLAMARGTGMEGREADA